MENFTPFQPEQEKSPAQHGFEIIKQIARKYESELRQILAESSSGSMFDLIVDGPVNAASLTKEFEQRAQVEGLDLSKFYEEAGRISIHGHRFEAFAIAQILGEHYRLLSKD